MHASAADTAQLNGIPAGMPLNSSAPRNDNLPATLFIATLFHGVIIMGVTFTVGNVASNSNSVDAMEVVILTRDYDKRNAPDDAAYLAQQNLTGSGNTDEDNPLRVAYGRGTNPVIPGPEQEGVQQNAQRPADQDQAQEWLHVRNPDAEQIALYKPRPQPKSQQLQTGMPGTANSIEILATPDTETILKGAQPRQLIVSANTRESRIATYLDSWKRRVERVGTMNLPSLDNLVRNPILSVNIAASGKLTEVIIVTSSGSAELDMAAVNILRMASPFEAFPDFMRGDYSSLKFTYEWRFSGNTVGKMKVPQQ